MIIMVIIMIIIIVMTIIINTGIKFDEAPQTIINDENPQPMGAE